MIPIILVLSALLMINSNAVLSGYLLQNIEPFKLLFWSTLITTCLFNVSRFFQTVEENETSLSYIWVPAINITSLVSWLGYFFALKYIEPAIVSAITGAAGPLIVILWFTITTRTFFLGKGIVATGIFLGAIFLFGSIYVNKSGITYTNTDDIMIGFASAVTSGIGLVATNAISKHMSNNGWTPSRIMANRFYLSVIVGGIITVNTSALGFGSLNEGMVVVFASFLGMLLPLWLLQKAIAFTPVFNISVLLSVGPIVTMSFQVFDSRISWSSMTLLGCSIIVVFTLINVYIEKKETMKV
ncbi:hypothetical protein BCT93_22765 [Vibrio lentus]|uniref:hypothetical protein n=1 Tax=Vibrio lentus TaxID=136468 RepID=UPI000C862BB2|nr:hypothetical protein [Vibrio lentus]PMK67067.1 hypothetical protein BCT93_22765 [Vibrio lentus]